MWSDCASRKHTPGHPATLVWAAQDRRPPRTDGSLCTQPASMLGGQELVEGYFMILQLSEVILVSLHDLFLFRVATAFLGSGKHRLVECLHVVNVHAATPTTVGISSGQANVHLLVELHANGVQGTLWTAVAVLLCERHVGDVCARFLLAALLPYKGGADDCLLLQLFPQIRFRQIRVFARLAGDFLELVLGHELKILVQHVHRNVVPEVNPFAVLFFSLIGTFLSSCEEVAQAILLLCLTNSQRQTAGLPHDVLRQVTVASVTVVFDELVTVVLVMVDLEGPL